MKNFRQVTLVLMLGGILIGMTIFSLWAKYDLGYPESAVVYKIYNLSRGQPIYRDWDLYPYSISPYTPVYYLLTGLIVAIGKFNLIEVYAVGRITTLIFTVGCAYIIYVLGRKMGGGRNGSLVCAGIFLVNPLLVPWGFTSRPDITALFFSLTGLVFFLKFGIEKPVLLAGWCTLAIYTKQTYLVLPLTILITGIIKKEYHFAMTFWGSFLLMTGAIFLLINQVTGGEFYRNVILANKTPIMINISPMMYLVVVLENVFILAAVLGSFGRKMPVENFDILIKVYFLLSLIWAICASLKPGADVNYFLEPMVLGIISAGPLIDKFLKSKVQPDLKIEAVGLFILFSLLWTIIRLGMIGDSGNVVSKIQRFGEPILTEDLSLTLRSGHKLIISDPYNFSFLEDEFIWNSDKLVNMIRNKSFKVIVSLTPINRPRMLGGVLSWPKSMIISIMDNYHLSGIEDNNYLYVPNYE